jgi:hypothetical protein
MTVAGPLAQLIEQAFGEGLLELRCAPKLMGRALDKAWPLYFRGIGLSLTGGRAASPAPPRHATHPVNAILNYGYSMLAGQVERTAVTRGLDVAVGSLHAAAFSRVRPHRTVAAGA